MFQTCQRSGARAGRGGTVCDEASRVPLAIYKYQILPLTELGLLSFRSLTYIVDAGFGGFAPVLPHPMAPSGQPRELGAEPHALSRS